MRQKTEILSIKKLIAATSNFSHSPKVMENQAARTRFRLDQGIDVTGSVFAPYKDKTRTHPNSRPLQRAARLFESPRYDTTNVLGGSEFRMTITGQAAKIARYQNIRRKFIGFSAQDRSDVKRDIFSMISETFKRWR